jgi:flagellar hook-length control protein FliK
MQTAAPATATHPSGLAPQQGDTPMRTLLRGQAEPKRGETTHGKPAATPPAAHPSGLAPQQGDTPAPTLPAGQDQQVGQAQPVPLSQSIAHPDPAAAITQVGPPAQVVPTHRAEPTPAAQPAVHEPPSGPVEQPQLTEALIHLRARGNGSHELTVMLHPAELGAVHVRASLHDGALSVTVACADDSARQAVTAALPDLHRALGDLGTVGLELQNSAGDQSSNGRGANPGSTQQPGSDTARRDPMPHGEPDGQQRRRHQTQSDDRLDQWM